MRRQVKAPMRQKPIKPAMTQRRSSPQARALQPPRGGCIQDQVYRQMFRLEERRPGAAMDLALALLRAWQSAGACLAGAERSAWLRGVSPICLEMIECALGPSNPTPSAGSYSSPSS